MGRIGGKEIGNNGITTYYFFSCNWSIDDLGMSEDKEEIQMKEEKRLIEEYTLSEETGDAYGKRRVATIIFADEKFNRCEYILSRVNSYSYKDWMFLLKVAEKIKELQEEKGGS